MLQFTTDDGVQIVCRTWCGTDTLPPLVLHHGFTGDATKDWVDTGVVALLTAAGRTVIAPDARGHGDSGKPHEPSAYGEARMARDLGQLIDALALPRVDLLGFSMGAVVALLAAVDDTRIRRLVVVGVGAGVVELGGIDRRVRPPEEILRLLLGASTARDGGAATAGGVGSRSIDPVALRAHASVANRTTIPLERITAPTLVLAGDADPLALRPEVLAGAIRGARLQVVAGDHGTAITNPDFIVSVVGFLAG